MILVNVIKVVAYVCFSVVFLALSPQGKKGFCLISAVGMRSRDDTWFDENVVLLALSPPGKKGLCLKSAVGMRIWIDI